MEENEIYNLGKYQSLKIKPENKEKMGLVEKIEKRTYNYVLYVQGCTRKYEHRKDLDIKKK